MPANHIPTSDLRTLVAMGEKAADRPWILGGASGRMLTTPSGYVGDGFLADFDTKDNAALAAAACNAAVPLALELLRVREENAELLKQNVDLKTRLKHYRDEDAPYRREENERIREQERDLRDAYHQGRSDADEQHFHDQQGGW